MFKIACDHCEKVIDQGGHLIVETVPPTRTPDERTEDLHFCDITCLARYIFERPDLKNPPLTTEEVERALS